MLIIFLNMTVSAVEFSYILNETKACYEMTVSPIKKMTNSITYSRQNITTLNIISNLNKNISP